MRARRVIPLVFAAAAIAGPLAACVPTPAPVKATKPAAPKPTVAPASAKCTILPANNVWHADISKLPVSTHSAAWLASTGAASRKLHPDFGGPYGIPVTTVAGNHAKVPVTFDYADESDRGLYPLGSDTQIEPGGGDSHAIVLDSTNCKLYETYATAHTSSGWTAGSGAVFDLRSNALRPDGYTSADAAGLPILPGLLQYNEVAAGKVDHAVRFTVAQSAASHLWPARHDAGSNNANLPPMGARFRLKANYPLTGLRPDTIAVLTAFKKYGLIVADNGSNWYFTGARDSRWSDDMLDQLKAVPVSAFEAVDESSLQASANSGQVR